MFFLLIRIVLFLGISAFIIARIRAATIVRKTLFSVLTVVFCIVCFCISAMFPVENIFVDFKSPESVFSYASSGRIDEIIYGKDSCMILYSRGNNIGGHYIIPKINNNYKIPSYFSTEKISHKFDIDGLFNVYHVKETLDFYVFGTVHLQESDNEIEVFNGEDEKIESQIIRVGNTNFIYFYLYDFSDGYYLMINGEKVLIS